MGLMNDVEWTEVAETRQVFNTRDQTYQMNTHNNSDYDDFFYQQLYECIPKEKLEEFVRIYWEYSRRNEISSIMEKTKDLLATLLEIIDLLNFLPKYEILIKYYSNDYERLGIPRLRQLKYHIHNYYNDLYILKSRTKKFVNLIEKLIKLYPFEKSNPFSVEDINNRFEKYNKIRNTHVHEFNFQEESLYLTELHEVVENNQSEEFMFYYENSRLKWTENIKNYNEELYDYYLDIFNQLKNSNLIIKFVDYGLENPSSE